MSRYEASGSRRGERSSHVAALGLALTVGLSAALLAVGCDATPTGPKPCNEDPFQCVNGETCWPNKGSTGFECLGGGAGQVGDTCQLVAGAPTCGQRLICIMQQESTTGVCAQYCDPPAVNRACLGGDVCAAFILAESGMPIKACVAPAAGSTGTGK